MRKIDRNDINIMIVCKSAGAQAYKTHFTNLNIRHYVISSGHEIENIPQILPINGVLVDISTFVKMDPHEKTILKEMEKIYPFARVKWNTDSGQINLMHHRDDVETVEDFIEKEARLFDPRIMRTSQRKEINLNVTLSDTRDFTGVQEKTTTLNISDTGFFIITSSRNWKENQRVFIVINELSLKTPIELRIIRKVEWGEIESTAPGISTRVDSILDSQQDELMDLL
ncbi:PilZ domain-containing protein [Chitinivibrio alkaliphilus]|uniref:Type IV pilus assembly protein PilZ n=1 Tax=Chitinivibrio alkaliphilus ACht1 TaxID=1313304 RepID=U7D8A9_9BACT|nr:PilZ domain-containing protein [Chitinivibrio alkaliphilus]ERP32178.1 type IV pilus assembly protein PilZ [Chitinivibrio alkaliphilus ACht1]